MTQSCSRTSVQAVDPIWLKPEVEGHTIPVETDRGTKYSIILRVVYSKQLCCIPLEPTFVGFGTVTSESFLPDGVAKVKVKFREKTSKLQLYVVSTPGPALFGRQWIEEFKLLEESSGME